MRGLTRVIDVYPTPEDFRTAIQSVIDSREPGEPILPTTVAVLLGVPEVSIRSMIMDDEYGAVVEMLYMQSLASVVEAIMASDKGAQALMALAKDLFGWWSGCAAFLHAAHGEINEGGLVLEQLLEDVRKK
jgi:hypothetical protein